MIDNPEIQVTIHSGAIVRTVVVSSRDSMHIALTDFPDCSHLRVIHDHSLLFTSFSWAFHGIESGAHIYTVPERVEVHPPPSPPKREGAHACSFDGFRRLFAEIHGTEYDRDLCSRCYALSHDKIGRQISRLRDRLFERVEGTVRVHRKMIRQFFSPKKRESDDSGDDAADGGSTK
jgi:hypothetical protein